jgi:aminoglycoside phosphotransferase (APT) family kinase protein
VPVATELSAAALVGLLLERGLVEPRSVVDGDLVVRDASSRNHNFEVSSQGGRSYFVKHAVGAGTRATLAREAAVLAQLRQTPMRRHVPELVAYDEERALVVLDRVERSRNPRYQEARGRFSRRLGELLGAALAALHSTTRGALPPEAVSEPPWPLSLHRPRLDWLRELSEASIELIKAAQRAPELGERLDTVRASWRTSCLIHRDFKWDNVLVVPDAGGRASAVRLADWELAGAGDPAWDVGAALAAYLSAWLRSIPVTGEAPPERFAELARLPLERMRPALRALWAAYARGAGLGGGEAERELALAVRFCAGRLLQSAFEQAQMSSRLSGVALCQLQVALNLLRRPHEGAVRLLGIPLGAP